MLRRMSVREYRAHKLEGFENMIYIGRKFGGFKESVLKNKFKIGKDGDRDEVIRKYRVWLWEEVKKRGDVWRELRRIQEMMRSKDVYLICWCMLNEACHGDVIIRCIEWMNK